MIANDIGIRTNDICPTPLDMCKKKLKLSKLAVRHSELLRNEVLLSHISESTISRSSVLIGLPEGYGVHGGAARNILEAMIFPDDTLPEPRDIDLVHMGPIDDWEEADSLASVYSPEDSSHGHSVQAVDNLADYIKGADFTINQVLFFPRGNGGDLYYTQQAAIDTKNRIIRPTVMEFSDDWLLSKKLALKAVMLQASLVADGIDASIRSVNLNKGRDVYWQDSYFFDALILNKSLERGRDVAEEYVRLLKSYGLAPDGARSLTDLWNIISKGCSDFQFTPKAIKAIKGPRRAYSTKSPGY